MSGFFDHGYARHAGGDPKAAAVGAVPSETVNRSKCLLHRATYYYINITPQKNKTPLIAHQDRTPPLSRVFALLYSTIDPQVQMCLLQYPRAKVSWSTISSVFLIFFYRRHHLAVTVKPAPKRTRTELTTLFLQTTKRKKGEATVSRLGLENRRCAELMWCDGRSLLERIIGGPCSRLPIKNIFIACCLIATMPSGKRELERVGNPPVSTGPSPNSDERANNTVEEVNGPTRGSGSLHLDLM
ncbi:hypothetical protein Tsp_04448 [Trichinella spiralis]|uniref:hypothetical protein n=1 Tax=Trichinella spiralis TaxID=6334 RepID=UPI0001EFEAFA|nr:hypothetical protein Tsp_04448 [Trichinella spiralis]